FPDVARHIVEAVAVRRETRYRRGSPESVGLAVIVGKTTLPDVRHPAAVRRLLIAPAVRFPIQPAPRRMFPFRFRRQSFARPLRIDQGVKPTHVNHRMILPALEV